MQTAITRLSLLESMKIWQKRATVSVVLIGVLVQQSHAMPANVYREFGNDHGLTNLQGREIVPSKYPYIVYVDHGLFLLSQRNPNPDQRFKCTNEKILINRNGIKLKTQVPLNATFEGIF
ncbi:MAG TPA: hypothetical protein EYM95_06715, partial [Candidatus Obscuribacterales bacterium]|nr:hypothetical protein [Candidatus Obscuribacterales bacterium]